MSLTKGSSFDYRSNLNKSYNLEGKPTKGVVQSFGYPGISPTRKTEGQSIRRCYLKTNRKLGLDTLSQSLCEGNKGYRQLSYAQNVLKSGPPALGVGNSLDVGHANKVFSSSVYHGKVHHSINFSRDGPNL